MPTVCDCVDQDWSGAAKARGSGETGGDSPPLRDQVHQALGQLIKQRRVYYTG